MKSKSLVVLVATVVEIFAVFMLAAPVTAQSDDQSRQLQQVEAVKIWPSKAKRWALIIGVDKYSDPQISPLKGADNDARNLSNALVHYAGFPQDQVILMATDQPAERQPTRVNILRRLSNLAAVVPKDGLLLISFAGHGIERGGQAYLIPADSQISDDIALLEESAVSVSRMKERIRATGVGQVVIFLDACRNDPGGRADANNPLTEAYLKGFNFDVRNREVTAFATLYATAVGQRAYEYTEKKQGYFTWALIEGLRGGAANEKGEVTLANLIKYVQDNVPKRVAIDLGSGKQQRPFSQMEGYKADELVIAVTSNAANAAANNTSAPLSFDPAAMELSFWDSIKNSTNPDDFKAYLDKYPDGQFAALARSRANPARPAAPATDSGGVELAYWNAIKDSKNPADFKAYIARFPTGFFTDLANSRLTALDAEARDLAVAKERAIDDTTWMGEVKTSATDTGRSVTVQFLRGGIFTATYDTVITVPGFLINDYKTETVKMAGTWRQEGNTISVQVSQPAAEILQLSLGEDLLRGGSVQGNYNFSVVKLLTKLKSAQPCDFRGFTVSIRFRVKDKVDRTAEADKLGEQLRGHGATVEVQKLNDKNFTTGIWAMKSQENIANMVAQCVKDTLPLKVVGLPDGTASWSSITANKMIIWLQQ